MGSILLKKRFLVPGLLINARGIIDSCKSVEIRIVEKRDVFELGFQSLTDANPYMDNSIEVKFNNGSEKVYIPWFYEL